MIEQPQGGVGQSGNGQYMGTDGGGGERRGGEYFFKLIFITKLNVQIIFRSAMLF